ncbi:MAG: lactate racemase domain-containing protein [Thermoguttaceae bacterium]|jgi:nickel-dependent lactate racemase|nr:lactate racemase domain-containing protein [Thermoguttaceae bacterium]
MASVLRYGSGSQVQLDLPAGVLLAECGLPRGEPLGDLSGAVARALTSPLDYPPLALGTTPSDRVVVPLDRGLPRAAQLVAAVVQCLVDGGVDPDGIAVLRTKADVDAGSPDPGAALPKNLQDRVTLQTHDPNDRGRLAYLARSHAGEPILLNRALTDADLVLPIGSISSRRAPGYHGVHGAVYPTFSDERTLHRFRSPDLLASRRALRKRLVRQCNEVGWLLGINFTVQVVPGAGDEVLHVLAGQSSSVRRRGWELYRSAWDCRAPCRASLVVAGIEGSGGQQTWQNVGQALAAAAALAEDGGAIALCCDLEATPGPGVHRLMRARSRPDALRQIRRELPEDALVAAQIARTLARRHVYLLSRLEPEIVEDLSMAPLSDPEDVARLARRHASCIVLANAAHALVTMENGT